MLEKSLHVYKSDDDDDYDDNDYDYDYLCFIYLLTYLL